MNTKLKQSKNQEKMKLIRSKMTAYFNSHFTDKELIVWQIQASDYAFSYFKLNKDEDSPGMDFLSSFSYRLIPFLLDAKNAPERKSIIERELVRLFSGFIGVSVKEALEEIGKAFLLSYKKCSHDGDGSCFKFMKHLASFMELSEMYDEYEFYEKEEQEENRKLKAA